MMDKKQCKALKFDKQRCTRSIKENSKYCWQHRFSRFGDSRWYNNAKYQIGIGLTGIAITLCIFCLGPSKSNQNVIIDQGASQKTADENRHRQAQEDNHQLEKQVAKLEKQVAKLEKAIEINPEIIAAIEKIFLQLLQKNDIPEWQWAEKLQEIAKLHQDLLDKWQMIQSGDPAIVKLRDKAYRMVIVGDYDKADQLLQEAVEIDRNAIQSQQEAVDKRKLSAAQSLVGRAMIAEARLDYNKAIDLYKEALDILPQNEQEKQATYLINLGVIYFTLADYGKAELLFEHALDIDSASLGPNHPNVARDLRKMADLYSATNRLKQAEAIYKCALEINEASLGPEDPNVAACLHNLAGLYYKTNRLKEAGPLLERALKIAEAEFDPSHRYVATCLHNLANLYCAMNRQKEAEPLYERALKIAEAEFDPSHPMVANCLQSLANLYSATNRQKEAESLYERALAIYEETFFGSDHPDIAMCLNNQAHLYFEMSRLKEAEPLFKRAVEIMEKRLGSDHPDTIKYQQDLDKCRKEIEN